MQTAIIKDIDREYLKEVDILEFVEFLFKKLDINNELEFNILFSDDGKITRLNRQFRNHDKPTNILSFYGYSGGIFGDIIISVDTMEREAKKKNKPIFDYMLFLIAHGFLHIAGYAHETIEKYDYMMAFQNRLIKEWKDEKTD